MRIQTRLFPYWYHVVVTPCDSVCPADEVSFAVNTHSETAARVLTREHLAWVHGENAVSFTIASLQNMGWGTKDRGGTELYHSADGFVHDYID